MSLRLALTTTRDRATGLVAGVEAFGFEAVLLPCIEVVPADGGTLEAARASAASSDLLVVTSPRVVTVLWPDGGMPDVPVAAVGASTAYAVEAAGGEVAVVGDAGADSLLDGLGDSIAGATVLLAQSANSHPSTRRRLENMGAAVAAVAIYDTRPIPPGPEPVDVVTFASPSAVEGWALSRAFDGVVLAAIGATTAAALTAAGHPPHVVPSRPDFTLLIEAVASQLGARSPA